MSDYVPPLEDIAFAMESVLQAPAAWAVRTPLPRLGAPAVRG